MLRAYGDKDNDGKFQLSFSLPVAACEKTRVAAQKLLLSIGFDEVMIAHMEDIGEGFTQFIAYASSSKSIDYEKIKVSVVDAPKMDMYEIDALIDDKRKTPIKLIGASIESDAHTVGIDAILNMKGYHGDYGLERYKNFETLNLGSQIACEEIIKKILIFKAEVCLVSQIITQNDLHIQNLTKLIDMLEAEKLREKVLMICGGPRISHELALELGYDAGFGANTLPSHVASFIVNRLLQKS